MKLLGELISTDIADIAAGYTIGDILEFTSKNGCHYILEDGEAFHESKIKLLNNSNIDGETVIKSLDKVLKMAYNNGGLLTFDEFKVVLKLKEKLEEM